MTSTNAAISRAIEYLGADYPGQQTYTISASVLRTIGRGDAFVRRLNGGTFVVGIAADGKFLPGVDGGPRDAKLTVRAAATEEESAQILSVLRDAVAKHPPAGSAYDPAVRRQWDEWDSLREEIGA